MKRYPLQIFFVLAFVFPWLIWGTTIAESRGLLSFHIPQSLAFWIGLNLATYFTAAITGGWAAIKELLSRLIRWRAQPVWYVVAFGITALLSLVAIGIYLALGGTHQVGVLLPLQALLPSLLFQIFWLFRNSCGTTPKRIDVDLVAMRQKGGRHGNPDTSDNPNTARHSECESTAH